MNVALQNSQVISVSAHDDRSEPGFERLARLTSFLEGRLGEWDHLPSLVRVQLLGGKRLRARLLFAAAPPGDPEQSQAMVRAAAAVELVHAGSLLHDDIVDQASRRRGHCAAYRLYGERFATRAGTFVMEEATVLFAGLPLDARLAFARAARAASLGQLAEIAHTGNLELGLRERLQIMDGKTAVIFQLAARLGAMLGGAGSNVVRTSAAVGRWFGFLFQLADDVEDLCASAEALGRPPGSDLRSGVVTLPVVFLVEARGAAAFGSAQSLAWRAEEPLAARDLRALFRDAGAFARARVLGIRWADRIEKMLEDLPDGPGRCWILNLTKQVERVLLERLEVADD